MGLDGVWPVMSVPCGDPQVHSYVPKAVQPAPRSGGCSPEHHVQDEARALLIYQLTRFCVFLLRNVLSKPPSYNNVSLETKTLE